MNFEFSEEDAQLRDAIQKWVAKDYTQERRKAIVEAGGFSREAYAELAGLGACGLQVAERWGGLDMGAVQAMVVMEELGRGLVLEPYAQTVVGTAVLGTFGGEDVQAAWCGGLADGTRMISLAHQEQGARYRAAPCATRALRVADRWEVSGVKTLVPAGDVVDGFIVPAMAEDRLSLFIVERGAPGVSTHPYGTQDGARAADVHFRAAAAQLLAVDGDAALAFALDRYAAALCAEGVGIMDKALAATVDYLRTRKQFGVELASFQALRHQVADMKMQLELARSMSYYATLSLELDPPARTIAVSRAKYQLGISMRQIGQQAVQLHGGIGMTDEYIVSHYFKRLTQIELTCGDTRHHLAAVSDAMKDVASVVAD